MKTAPFRTEDIDPFLSLASQEQWVVEQWEPEFLLQAFPGGCFTVRDESGQAVGFITSLPHGRSGWIGNLIVAPHSRGQGWGESLFLAALRSLLNGGMATVWLTASQMGMGLYEKHGFTRLDTISRWRGMGRLKQEIAGGAAAASGADHSAISLDLLAWGDCRKALLDAVMKRGRSLIASDGFLTLQPCGAGYQIGPFAAFDDQVASGLLKAASSMVPDGTPLCLDIPASNRAASQLLSGAGFTIRGTNELMYLGKKPSWRPELLYGLATMGSCG